MRWIKNSCAVLLLSCLAGVQLKAARFHDVSPQSGCPFDRWDAAAGVIATAWTVLCGSGVYTTRACYADEFAGDCTHLVAGTIATGVFAAGFIVGGAYHRYRRCRQSAPYGQLDDNMPGVDF